MLDLKNAHYSENCDESQKGWILGQVVVITSLLLPPTRTIRTPPASISTVDPSFPLMAFAAAPPDLFVRAFSYSLWGKRSVSSGMPLFGEARVDRSQTVVDTCPLTRSIRTPLNLA